MTVQVDASNSGQLDAWDGDTGAFWVRRAERFNEGVARYHPQLLAAAEIGEADKVLDIGCGNGQVTRDAARLASAGSALGVDLSSAMLGLAKELAEREGVANASFAQVDAQVHPFAEGGFDVAISRHGVMFFGDPPAAFANIARALRPGGRLVALTWQPAARIEWMTRFREIFAAGRELPAASPPALSLSDPDVVRELLGSAGFVDVRVRGLSEPMYFGRDVEDAAGFIEEQFGGMARELSEEVRAGVLAAMRADLAEHLTSEGVLYGSAAWLIEARRG